MNALPPNPSDREVAEMGDPLVFYDRNLVAWRRHVEAEVRQELREWIAENAW